MKYAHSVYWQWFQSKLERVEILMGWQGLAQSRFTLEFLTNERRYKGISNDT